MYLEDLPHVGGVATRSEPDRVNRVVAEMKAVLRQREADVQAVPGRIDGRRTGRCARTRTIRRSADPFGDVFLVIDGWPAFVAEFPDLGARRAGSRRPGSGVRRAHHDLHTALDRTEVACARLPGHQDRVPARRRQRDADRPHHPRDPAEPARPRDVDGEAPPDDRGAAARRCAQRATTSCPRSRRRCRTSRARTREQAPRVRVLPERIYLHELDPNPPARTPTTAPGGPCRSAFASRTCRWPTTTCTRRRTC